MRFIEYARKDVNAQGLNEEIQDVFGERYLGSRTGPFGIHVNVPDDFTAAEEVTLDALVANHVSTKKSRAEINREVIDANLVWLRQAVAIDAIQDDINAGRTEDALNKLLQVVTALVRVT